MENRKFGVNGYVKKCYDTNNYRIFCCRKYEIRAEKGEEMIHILIVEDDQDLNKAVCKHLSMNQYQVTGCMSAQEAYNQLYGGSFDLIISDIMMQNDYFQTRLTSTLEGNSSGRDEIYSHIWNVFNNSNMFHYLFGYGAQGSFIMTAKFAHSDWLELLINQGLLGFIIYINYIIIISFFPINMLRF